MVYNSVVMQNTYQSASVFAYRNVRIYLGLLLAISSTKPPFSILLFFSTRGPASSVAPPATTSHALRVKQERMEDDTFEHGAMSQHLEEVRPSFFRLFVPIILLIQDSTVLIFAHLDSSFWGIL